ncbi:protein SHQ1 [Angomonas deanei]|nr:protein SHQ1 [Angomonas deanei]|eukprot:EPY26394.1 protein SHQ1 [Angomonas deanei]
MLTPVFSCEQNEEFVIVKIVLSAICKVMEAVFDINDCQFTFYCSPYYLRLVFNEALEEGKGERATYDLETNTLSVYLPKSSKGAVFTELDNPGYLIATAKQRKALLQVVGEGEEEEEVEFIQSLNERAKTTSAGDPYGFGNSFSGLFAKVDADVLQEMVSLRDPEASTVESRRRERIAQETADFDEEAVLVCFEDEDGSVEEALRYVPHHIEDFMQALKAEGTVYATKPAAQDENTFEEESSTIPAHDGGPAVEVWCGNVSEFRPPLIQEVEERAATPAAASPNAAVPSKDVQLAVPRVLPTLTFTNEENEVLIKAKCPRLLVPPTAAAVEALTVDLLLAEAYDDLFTQGTGCCESLWTICSLSTSLSYLDSPDSVYDACFNFFRRALIYPLYRHPGVVQRLFAIVGTRLLLGRNYVVRALVRVRNVLSHAEHRHVLATLYLDPLIAYWMNAPNVNERLLHLSLEIHEHVRRTCPTQVANKSAGLPSLVISNKEKHSTL